MTLTATAETPFRSGANRWILTMRAEGSKDLQVDVSDCALLAIGAPCVDGIPQLDEGEYRSRIENIASAKHNGGHIEIVITQEDID